MKHIDLIIVGGGPIGIACGLEAKKEGVNYLIIEKKRQNQSETKP